MNEQYIMHNLRNFLAANLTQNYFLIARMLSFFCVCDISDNFDIGYG